MLTCVNKIRPAVKQAGYCLKQLLMAPGVRSFSPASASYQRRKFRACGKQGGKQASVVLRIALSARERAVDFETRASARLHLALKKADKTRSYLNGKNQADESSNEPDECSR
jgi:hypothetical protein